jgi:hypothetical protein
MEKCVSKQNSSYTRALVPQDVRQLHVHLLTPDSLNDMKVGNGTRRPPNS